MLRLRPMVPDEFALFAATIVEGYARTHTGMPDATILDARLEATRQLVSLLGEGAKRETDDRLWALEDEAGEFAGGVWAACGAATAACIPARVDVG
jgi:hypothetical protein